MTTQPITAGELGRPMLCQDRPRVEGYTGPNQCAGAVDFRPSLSGTGTPTIRCDAHWKARLDWQRQHDRDYPDSDTPPRWFDPTYAGESWNEPD